MGRLRHCTHRAPYWIVCFVHTSTAVTSVHTPDHTLWRRPHSSAAGAAPGARGGVSGCLSLSLRARAGARVGRRASGRARVCVTVCAERCVRLTDSRERSLSTPRSIYLFSRKLRHSATPLHYKHPPTLREAQGLLRTRRRQQLGVLTTATAWSWARACALHCAHEADTRAKAPSLQLSAVAASLLAFPTAPRARWKRQAEP